jgi:addiction module HigA family antidote
VKSISKVIHPGQIVRLKLQILGVSISAAARALGINRTHFSDLVNGHVGISPTVALRLSLGIGGRAEDWMEHQTDYELHLARGRFLAISRQVQKIDAVGKGDESHEA